MTTKIGFSPYSARVTNTIPTASMNSLANAANAIGTTAIDNTAATPYKYIEFDFTLASIDLSTQTSPAIYIWLLERVDGTNYEDGGASVTPARNPDIIIPLRIVSGAQIVQGACQIKPGYFLALISNRSGAAMAASGNSLNHKFFSDEIA